MVVVDPVRTEIVHTLIVSLKNVSKNRRVNGFIPGYHRNGLIAQQSRCFQDNLPYILNALFWFSLH
jgi:hypothetical protein